VLAPDEFKGAEAKQFGLDQPRLSIVLFEGDRPVLGAHFGGRNPDGMLEYVMVEGRRELYLLSRFVGEEWDAAAKAALARWPRPTQRPNETEGLDNPPVPVA
jgi:hypothetical protein